MKTPRSLLGSVLVAAAACAVPAAAQAVQIDGAGVTFPYPIYSKWFSEYNKIRTDVQINYQSIGSGGGIRQLTNQTVFFGATDGPIGYVELIYATQYAPELGYAPLPEKVVGRELEALTRIQ